MRENPIVKEIHKHRREMLGRCNGDRDAFFDYRLEKQEKSGRQRVILPKKASAEG